MKKDQIVILEDRGLISISGNDAKDFLQNIITNDINKVSIHNSIFAALLSPQGKYLFEFFIVYSERGYLLDCAENSTKGLIENLSKYKLRSKVEINDLSNDFVVGVISYEKFKDLQKKMSSNENTIHFRESAIFLDPRQKKLGAKILSNLDKLYLTIKKLDLKIIDNSNYYEFAHKLGIPERGLIKLKDQLFGLEANFDVLQAIDFKKGCFIGQENTARMKLKNKLRRKLIPIKSDQKLNIGEELTFKNSIVGKILINDPFPFALIKLFDPNFSDFKNQNLNSLNGKVRILNSD